MATSPNATPTPITPPRVPLIDERTGLIDRSWYLFFLSLFQSATEATNANKAPDVSGALATYDAALRALAQATETQPPQIQCCVEIDAVRQEMQSAPPVGVSELAQEVNALRQEVQSAPPVGVAELAQEVDEVRQQLQTLPRTELGTFAVLQQANLPWTTFDTTPQSVPETDTGTVYWSNDDATLNVVLEGGVAGQVCQQLDFHPKNTSGVQINKGQAVMATGVVGASTKITCAKAVANGTVPPQFMLGIAAQDIPANSFGYVVWFGSVRGFDTTGANKTVPETWVDGDVLYFDPAYPGELTKVEPFAPNLDLPIAIVTNAANNGAIFVRMKTGEKLDELHDVHAPTPAAGDVLAWDAVDGRWENTPASSIPSSTATNLAGGLAGSVPYQSAPSTTTFLSIGAANTVMTSSGTAPQWSSSLSLSGTLAVNGNVTLGDASTDTVRVNGYMGVGGAAASNVAIYLTPASLTGTGQTGVWSRPTGTTAGTTQVNGYVSQPATSASAYTVTSVSGLRAEDVVLGAGSTISDQNGVFVADQTRGTNNFGVRSAVSSGANKWNIYASGTAANYFAGNVEFAAGTAASPALARFGDNNTGIFFPSADTIAFSEGGVETMRLDSSGNVRVGTAALATTATNGFLYIPTCAGTPTGTPTTITGLAPLVVDSTNNKLYFYSGGAWRDAGP